MCAVCRRFEEFHTPNFINQFTLHGDRKRSPSNMHAFLLTRSFLMIDATSWLPLRLRHRSLTEKYGSAASTREARRCCWPTVSTLPVERLDFLTPLTGCLRRMRRKMC